MIHLIYILFVWVSLYISDIASYQTTKYAQNKYIVKYKKIIQCSLFETYVSWKQICLRWLVYQGLVLLSIYQ